MKNYKKAFKLGLRCAIIISLLTSCKTLKTQKELAKEFYNLGNSYLELKNYTKAQELYLKSLQYNQNINEAVINLVVAYQNLSNYAEAEKTILKYYKRNISDFNKKLLILLGKNYYIQNNFTKAIYLYGEYMKSYPEDPVIYYNLGLCYLKTGNDDEAIRNFLISYSKDATFMPAVFNISKYYFVKENYTDSLKYLSEVSKKISDNPEIYYMFYKIQLEMKDYELAFESIKKAIELSKETTSYYLDALKLTVRIFNDKQKSIEYMDNALKYGYSFSKLTENEEVKIIKETYKDEYNSVVKKYKQ